MFGSFGSLRKPCRTLLLRPSATRSANYLAGVPTAITCSSTARVFQFWVLVPAGCPTTYHTAQDNPGTLDSRTVQDLGEYELRLARHFGNLDLKHMPENDVIYAFAAGVAFLCFNGFGQPTVPTA